MYKKAAQQKLRIATSRGNLSVEQLFDLPKEEIADLARAYRRAIAEKRGDNADGELDFLRPAEQQGETPEELAFRLLKDIYLTKQAAEDDDRRRTKARQNNRKLLEIIARKQDQELEGKSIEELEAMLEEE